MINSPLKNIKENRGRKSSKTIKKIRELGIKVNSRYLTYLEKRDRIVIRVPKRNSGYFYTEVSLKKTDNDLITAFYAAAGIRNFILKYGTVPNSDQKQTIYQRASHTEKNRFHWENKFQKKLKKLGKKYEKEIELEKKNLTDSGIYLKLDVKETKMVKKKKNKVLSQKEIQELYGFDKKLLKYLTCKKSEDGSLTLTFKGSRLGLKDISLNENFVGNSLFEIMMAIRDMSIEANSSLTDEEICEVMQKYGILPNFDYHPQGKAADRINNLKQICLKQIEEPTQTPDKNPAKSEDSKEPKAGFDDNKFIEASVASLNEKREESAFSRFLYKLKNIFK